jgi:hypothetical protein
MSGQREGGSAIRLFYAFLCRDTACFAIQGLQGQSCVGMQRASLTASGWFDEAQLVTYAGVMEDLSLIQLRTCWGSR